MVKYGTSIVACRPIWQVPMQRPLVENLDLAAVGDHLLLTFGTGSDCP
jgi:hypothetical protein